MHVQYYSGLILWVQFFSFFTTITAYSGRFCEEDVDACVEQFCFEGVLCTDNPAPQIGATCRSCPSGLQGDGRNCIGK